MYVYKKYSDRIQTGCLFFNGNIRFEVSRAQKVVDIFKNVDIKLHEVFMWITITSAKSKGTIFLYFI